MSDKKKGITVKVDEELHAEVTKYIQSHNMTMSEFVALALNNELHPQITMKGKTENMRTLAFQVPDELFQKIKDYLQRNNMTQKEFIIGLIEDELERDQVERENLDDTDELSEEDDSEFEESEDVGMSMQM